MTKNEALKPALPEGYDDRIVKTIFLNASRDTVWSFLTDKDKLGLWFRQCDADLQMGAEFNLLGDNGNRVCWGTVTHYEPPHLLEYSFTAGPLDGAFTTVRWTLEELPEGTRVSLVHEGIAAAITDAMPLLTGFDAGWDEYILNLRKQCE